MNSTIGALLILLGSMLMLIASIGLLRLPDPLMRMHASSKASILGMGCVLLGTAISIGTYFAIFKAVSAILLVCLTVPISAQLLGRAALLKNKGNFEYYEKFRHIKKNEASS